MEPCRLQYKVSIPDSRVSLTCLLSTLQNGFPEDLLTAKLHNANVASKVRKEEQTIIGLRSDSATFERTSKNGMPMPNHKRDNHVWRAKLNSGARANCEKGERGGRPDDRTINNSLAAAISSKFPDARRRIREELSRWQRERKNGSFAKKRRYIIAEIARVPA